MCLPNFGIVTFYSFLLTTFKAGWSPQEWARWWVVDRSVRLAARHRRGCGKPNSPAPG